MTCHVVGHGLTPEGWVEFIRFPITVNTPLKGISERVVRAVHQLGGTGATVQIVAVEAGTSGAVLDEAHLCCRSFGTGEKCLAPRAMEGQQERGVAPPCGLPLIRRGLKFPHGQSRAECVS